MINILHVSDKLSVGDATLHGVTRLFSWWIPRFDKKRFNVSACNLRKRDKAAEYLESQGIKVFCLGRGKFNPLTLFDLIKIVRKNDIHILHLHGYGAWTFGRIIGVFYKIHIVLHEHMVDHDIPIYQRIVDRVLSMKKTHSIAISHSVKEFMINARYIPNDQIEVIYNGIPMEPFKQCNKDMSNDETINGWRKKLHISSTRKIVGTVGRLSQVKGQRYFLDAAKKVLLEYSNVEFLVVGDGELRGFLEKRVVRLGIENRVHFIGYCNDMVPLLSMMDILVISSQVEGGPLTLFEGFAAGCAIVSTNTIGLKDTLDEGRTGFLVEPMDVNEMANRINMLLGDNNLLTNMKLAARKEASKFDIKETIKKLEDCYQNLMETSC